MEFELPGTKWMWLPQNAQKAEGIQIACFRRKFSLEGEQFLQKKKTCLIRISADTRYKLYVNGTLVQYGPSKGDRNSWFYDEVNLSEWLREGENVLAVEVLYYPAGQDQRNYSLFSTQTPGLYVEECEKGHKEPIDQNYEDYAADNLSESQRGLIGISGNAKWKCRQMENVRIIPETVLFAPLTIMEERSGDRELNGWNEPGFEDETWDSVVVRSMLEITTSSAPGNLYRRTIPYMYRKGKKFNRVICCRETSLGAQAWESMLAGKGTVEIPAHSLEIIEIDAGEEETGFVVLKMADGCGSVIRLLYSEAYGIAEEPENDLYIPLPTKTDRLDWKNGKLHGFSDCYHVAGYGEKEKPEVYLPFWFRTFRFIRIEVETQNTALSISGLDYEETGYPLEIKTHVETSDATLAPVWEISERSLRRCMQETYTDCPFYEQLQYAMDSRSQILYTYAVSADDRLARKCMDDFRKSQNADGMINSCYPSIHENVIPGFSIYYILMLHDHMMYFGDKQFLRRFLGSIDQILNFFEEHLDERNLVGRVGGYNGKSRYWSFIDWVPEWESGVPKAAEKGTITMESLLYLMGLEAASDLFTYMDRQSTAEEYRSRAQRVRHAVQKYCTDEKGMFTDGPGVEICSQHVQVFAILTDTVDIKRGKMLLEKTLDMPQDYAQCSVAMAYYLFRAMEKTELYARTEEKWDLWRGMVENHLTTCVEDGMTGRSDCHAWGALALYELPSVTLGVRPAAPGYSKAYILPVTGYMDWAKGSVITPKGTIEASWKKEESGKVTIDYKAPEEMEVIEG